MQADSKIPPQFLDKKSSKPRKPYKRAKDVPWGVIDDFERGRQIIMRQVNAHTKAKIKLFNKVFDGNGTLRMAIKAKCLECGNFSTLEVKECRVFTCPLWRYRPFQTDKETE